MRRLLQIVAFIAVALLAAQPALAGMRCDMGMSACHACAHCCHSGSSMDAMEGMAGDGMGAECAMPTQAFGAACAPTCCDQATPAGLVQVAAAEKSKAEKATFVALLSQSMPSAQAHFTDAPPGLIASNPPPRYILFQVFRI